MLQIKMQLSASAVIASGKSTVGEQSITVGDDFVSSLSEAERAELAVIVEKGTAHWIPGVGFCCGVLNGHVEDAPIIEATPEALRSVLSARAEHRASVILREEQEKAKAEAEKVRLLTCPVGDLLRTSQISVMGVDRTWRKAYPVYGCPEQRMSEVEAEAARLNEIEYAPIKAARVAKEEAEVEKKRAEKEFSGKLTEWLKQFGTALQIGRREHGFMPDAQILALLREDVFQPLSSIVRFKRLEADDLRCEASGEPPEGDDFGVEEVEVTTLSDAEYTELEVIRQIVQKMASGSTIEVRGHKAWCSCDSRSCTPEGTEVFRNSVLVTTEWNGRKLSREYALVGAVI